MKKNLNFLIIGMFRSGTSFLSNLINSHSKAYCVYDPYIHFIKIYDAYLKKKKFNEHAEIDHYFSKNHKIKDRFINKLSKLDLNNKISFKNKLIFKKLLIKYKLYQHPNIKFLKITKKTQSFKEFFLDTLLQMKKLNSHKKYYLIGTKISWCEEYLPVFLNTFKNLKILFIYRDIKSIISSGIQSEIYGELPLRPVLYYVYYWKKNIFFYNKFKKKILPIKYENLVTKFPSQKRKIFDYLKIKNEEIKNIKDQYDRKWSSNSSYKIESKSLIKDTRKFYKKKLDNDLIKTIDFLCKNELNDLGYAVKNIKKLSKKRMINCLKRQDSKSNFKGYKKYLNYSKCLDELI